MNNQRWDLPRVSQVESSVFLTQWSTEGTLIGVEMDNPLSNIDIILNRLIASPRYSVSCKRSRSIKFEFNARDLIRARARPLPLTKPRPKLWDFKYFSSIKLKHALFHTIFQHCLKICNFIQTVFKLGDSSTF